MTIRKGLATVLVGCALACSTTVTHAQEATPSYPPPDAPLDERAEYLLEFGFLRARVSDRFAYDAPPDATYLELPFHVAASVELPARRAGVHHRLTLRYEGMEYDYLEVRSGSLIARRSHRAARASNPWRYVGVGYGLGAGLQRLRNDREGDTGVTLEAVAGIEFGMSRFAIQIDGFARQGLPIDFNGDDRSPLIFGTRVAFQFRIGGRAWLR